MTNELIIKATVGDDIRVISQQESNIQVSVQGAVLPAQNATTTYLAGSAIVTGQPVRVIVNSAYPASNESELCVGIALNDANTGQNVTVQHDGVYTRADWSAITGNANLSIGGTYYLHSLLGQLTLVAPVSGWVKEVGTAVTAKDLHISIKPGLRRR